MAFEFLVADQFLVGVIGRNINLQEIINLLLAIDDCFLLILDHDIAVVDLDFIVAVQYLQGETQKTFGQGDSFQSFRNLVVDLIKGD